jgi:hypothetical protein
MLGLSNNLSNATGRQLGKSTAALLATDYATRVTTDGGVVEGLTCLTNALYDLGVRNTFDYTDSIFERWINDGGTVEATICFINDYFFLNTQ